MHKGVKYIDRNKSIPPSVVPPGTTASDLLFPSDYAHYIEGEGWKNKEILKANIVGDVLKPHYTGVIKAYLVLKVGEKKFTYEFGFKTDVIEESKISTISEMKKFPISKVAYTVPAATEIEIKKGMTIAEVEKLLGKPLKATKFGKKTLYKYGDYKIIFVDGKVAEVDF
jgi:hypothetical protein